MRKLSFFLLTWFITISTFAQMGYGIFSVKHLENNTKRSDYGVTFLNDDKIIFVSPIKERKKNGPTGVFEGTINSDGEITTKDIIADFSKNKISKTGLTYSKDLKTVYFSSNNLRKVYSKTKEYRRTRINRKKSQLFKATVQADGSWSNIETLPFTNRRYTLESPVLSNDGKQLYFISNNKKETLGGKDIFVVAINDDGSYGEPKNLGPTINTKGDETTPFITKDKMLYFASNGRSDTLGELDIYVSDISKETPTEPIHLDAPINTESNDFAFIINTEKTRGFISSNRLKNNNDIYSFTAEGLINRKCVQEITGIIKDKETEETINNVLISLFDSENNEIEQVKTDAEGHYKFTLECDKAYNLTAFNEAYETEGYTVNTVASENYNAPDLEANKFLTKKIADDENENSLEEIKSSINPVYFGYDKSDITTETASELDKLVEILKTNENIQVEVAAYTDSRGSSTYNLTLSERRANVATEYLVTQGVDKNRIVSKGYGESKLINKCSDDTECSEAAHQENRRIEFSFTNL